MNFESLECFEAIIATGSFRKAAEKLNKAQPAVSYAIKNLESELNLELFDRTQYKPSLTPAGEILYLKITRLIEQKNDLLQLARTLKEGGDFQVRLSITALFPLQKISDRLKAFTLDHPHTDLKINVDVLSTMFRLENEEADIGITELLHWPYEKFEAIELCKIKMIPVISAQHPLLLAQPDKVFSAYEIKNIPQIIIQSTLTQAKDIKAGIISENLKWRVSDFKTKETMILEALGWGFMPDHMVREQLEVKNLKVLNLENNSIFDYPLYALRSKNPKRWGPSLDGLWGLLTSPKL
jgi:DNA-binding transcriptional LysR family regulator